MAAKKYSVLERSGRRFKPIEVRIVSNASLIVIAKATTIISLLSGISSPPLN
ncbi:hypothetical protein [Lapidilactobacillus bayanensis]|uniref:hypothetical protein n=1 Tax=Lapidilactobacillus bayanensis TaxID=2485998 RepID=UPI0013DE5255|nr:hypothetical protein [Lapidilactobacillus bayanensis]